MTDPTPDPPKLKAAAERLHETYIITGASGDFHQVCCDTPGCSWESPEFDGRRHLAELAALEHQRAMAGWPGTAPSGDAPTGDTPSGGVPTSDTP